MKLLTTILVLFVATSHIGIMILEMFYWDHEVGRKIFSMTVEQSAASAVLAMNQGLYNGFLAAGLLWGLISTRFDIKVFFLLCVVVAGVFGAATARDSILFTQAMPAAIALSVLFLANRKQF
ncbi:MAG: putative membrane protein [Dinoroseobacter sp.]|jgi:putative membrane protein